MTNLPKPMPAPGVLELGKIEIHAKSGHMGPYSAQFVELIALIRKQEAALQASSKGIQDSSATVDTPEFRGLLATLVEAGDYGPDEYGAALAPFIANIDAHTSAAVARAVEDGRRLGRAEALAILMQLDAETGIDDYIGWTSSDTPEGEGSAYWKLGKLRELFSVDGDLADMMDQAESQYWHYKGLQGEAERAHNFAVNMHSSGRVREVLAKAGEYDLMADLCRAAQAAPVAAMPEGWREFAEAIANNYDCIDRETDEEMCCGCSGLIDYDGVEHHRPECIVLRARAYIAAHTQQPAAVPAEQVQNNGGVKPAGFDVCPISGRPFWGNIDHPKRGMLATYGGPFDTYSIPYLDEDDELRVERFDQDRGEWIEGGEPFGWYYSEQQPDYSTATQPPAGELPVLPEPDTHCFDEDTGKDVWSHSTEQVRKYGRLCATRQPAPVADAAEPEHMDTEQSREYLVSFMEQYFTDKTFHRYIRGKRVSMNLAGDFAWQMARALRMIGAINKTGAA